MQLKETLKALSHKHKSLNQANFVLCTNLQSPNCTNGYLWWHDHWFSICSSNLQLIKTQENAPSQSVPIYMHDMRVVPLLSVIRVLTRQLPAGRLVLRAFVFKRSPGNPQPIPDLACVQTLLPSVKISSTEGRGVLYTGYTRTRSGEFCNPILEHTPPLPAPNGSSYARVKILQKLQRFYISLLLM